MAKFFEDLKRQPIYAVAVAYAVMGWIGMQLTNNVIGVYHDHTAAVVELAFVAGFPVVLILAWMHPPSVGAHHGSESTASRSSASARVVSFTDCHLGLPPPSRLLPGIRQMPRRRMVLHAGRAALVDADGAEGGASVRDISATTNANPDITMTRPLRVDELMRPALAAVVP